MIWTTSFLGRGHDVHCRIAAINERMYRQGSRAQRRWTLVVIMVKVCHEQVSIIDSR